MVAKATWELVFSKQALKDAKKLKAAGLKGSAEEILDELEVNPFLPPMDKLKGDLVPTIQKVVRAEVNQMFDRSARFAKAGI